MRKRIVIILIPLLRLLVYSASIDNGAMSSSSGRGISTSTHSSSSLTDREVGIQHYMRRENSRWLFYQLNFWEREGIDYVEHFVYSACEVEPEKEWQDFLTTRLEESYGSTDTPLVIKRAWKFKWDGRMRRVVYATNFVSDYWKWDDKKYSESINIPPCENPLCYEIVALFADGARPVIIDNLSEPIRIERAGEIPEGYTLRFYPPGKESDYEYAMIYQQGRDEMRMYPVFRLKSQVSGLDFVHDSFTLGRIKGDSRLALLADHKSGQGSFYYAKLYFLEGDEIYWEKYNRKVFDMGVPPAHPVERSRDK